MTFKVSGTKIKTIKNDDRMFYIRGDLTLTPRAGFEISNQCPRDYRLILADCIERGWIKPIAYMRDDEYLWEELKE